MKHPLESFVYCPRCGSHNFAINGERSRRCADCGLTYYANASASTAAIITNSKGEVLLTTRAFEPAKGKLDLPGGFVDMYETAEEALIRELKEETGYITDDLFIVDKCYTSPGIDNSITYIVVANNCIKTNEKRRQPPIG